MQYLAANQCRAALRERGVTLALTLAVNRSYRHFGNGMNFIVIAKYRIMLSGGVIDDVIDSSLDGRVHVLNDRLEIKLLGRTGDGSETT